MSKREGIGNRIAPPHFIASGAVFVTGVSIALVFLPLSEAVMIGFDAAAVLFLALCLPLLKIKSPMKIERLAERNDANRTLLLALTGLVMTVLLLVMGVQTVGGTPEPFTKILILATDVLAWLFSNTVYALHYAHLA